jgi:predicted transcriptional regulator
MKTDLAAKFAEIDSDSRYDLADIIGEWLDARPGQWFSPSRIARAVKMDTWQARHILDFMVERNFAIARGNGGWTNYAGWTSR